MFAKKTLLLLISMLLLGCVSEQEQHELNQKKCKGYGYKLGTERFADCMKEIDFHNDNRDDLEEDRLQRDEHHDDKMESISGKKYEWKF